MRPITDYIGRVVRLTDERLAHICEHPEMVGHDSWIEESLSLPDTVYESSSDPSVNLYYRRYPQTAVGMKLLCVVVKLVPGDAFVITAYLTDKEKRGVKLWP